MLSLVVLFTVFLGLIGALLLSAQCQKRRAEHARAHDTHANLARLTAWLEDKGHSIPSAATVIRLLNRVAKRDLQSEDWQALQITELLARTELPQFSVHQILQQTAQDIEFKVGIEWPMCLPGVGVALLREGEEGQGEERRVTCELQVDWMYAEATVRLANSDRGLLLGYKHTRRPQMALSCLVTTQGVKQSEELASSVAHSLQLLFYQMELSNERLWTEEGEEPALPQSTPPDNSVFSTTTALSMNHNTVPHSKQERHRESSTHSEASSQDTDITPPSSTHSSASQLGEVEVQGAKEEEEREEVGGEGDGSRSREGEGKGQEVVPVENGLEQTVLPDSRKLWTRNGIGDKAEAGGREEGGRRRERVDESSPEAVRRRGSSREEDETQSPRSQSDTGSAPRTPTLIVTAVNETPPSLSSHNCTNHPSPLTTQKYTPNDLAYHRSKSMLSWRRSPSYENLQQFTLPSVREGSVVEKGEGGEGGRGEDMDEMVLSPTNFDRRNRQSLSMSGSAYSVQSREDEMYPSTLVFEIEDSERTRHIVALSQAHASKLRKRVTHARKLHIYNDHIFVATHLKQRFYCHMCKKKIAGFVGKQGYVCRDCNMVVHKHCHYKVEGRCTSSKLSSMNLIYPDSVSTISGL